MEKPEPRAAVADLQPIGGTRVSGTLTFVALENGSLQIGYTARRLPGGSHGLYAHRQADCSSGDGSSAGDYLDLGGANSPDGARLGDVTSNVAGIGRGRFVVDGLSLQALLGHSVMIEVRSSSEGALQPVACGVVQAR